MIPERQTLFCTAPGTVADLVTGVGRRRRRRSLRSKNAALMHDLQTLVATFHIPQVPDVSAADPEAYQRNRDTPD